MLSFKNKYLFNLELVSNQRCGEYFKISLNNFKNILNDYKSCIPILTSLLNQKRSFILNQLRNIKNRIVKDFLRRKLNKDKNVPYDENKGFLLLTNNPFTLEKFKIIQQQKKDKIKKAIEAKKIPKLNVKLLHPNFKTCSNNQEDDDNGLKTDNNFETNLPVLKSFIKSTTRKSKEKYLTIFCVLQLQI